MLRAAHLAYPTLSQVGKAVKSDVDAIHLDIDPRQLLGVPAQRLFLGCANGTDVYTSTTATPDALQDDEPTTKVADGELVTKPEGDVQAHMKTIADLLNSVPGRTVFWDFGINQSATLNDYKPDGHARLAQSSAHAINPLQQAVLVELKKGSTFGTEAEGTPMCVSVCVR